MFNIGLVATGLLCLLVLGEAYRFSRLDGLLDNFHEYDTIDTNSALNAGGVDVALSTDFTVFGVSFDAVKIYDTGYISLAPDQARVNVDLLNGDPIVTTYPYISANWFPDWVGYSYKMAHRQATSTTSHLQHDLDRINVEINRALDQYPETWRCNNALIVTWETSLISDATKLDKYQVVLASGNDAAGVKDYVLFLYEALDISSDEHPFAYVNGFYNSINQAKGAAVCSQNGNFQYLKTFSNKKCGNYGIFILDMADGQHCSRTELQQCGSVTKENCMLPMNPPQDTCTESYYCYLNEDGSGIEFALSLKFYQYQELSGLDYPTFIGSGTDSSPGEDGILDYIPDANCAANTNALPNAGTPAALVTRYFTTDIADGAGNCGVQVDTTAKTLKFAFAVYDPAEREVVKDGNYIVYGVCYYSGLARDISQTKRFNDPEPPTSVPVRQRSVVMSWVDASGAEVTAAEIGDQIYSQICFDPGPYFNLNVDPFGINVIDCYIANNENMYNLGLPGTERSVLAIDQGCVALQSTQAFYFKKTFKVKPPANMGQLWCIKTGEMEAAKFEVVGGSDKIWMQCTYSFCTKSDETICHDSCATGTPGRGTRSVNVATNATGVESISVSLNVKDKQEGYEATREEVCGDDYVDKTTVIATVCLLVSLILISCIVAVMMLLRLKNRKRR